MVPWGIPTYNGGEEREGIKKKKKKSIEKEMWQYHTETAFFFGFIEEFCCKAKLENSVRH